MSLSEQRLFFQRCPLLRFSGSLRKRLLLRPDSSYMQLVMTRFSSILQPDTSSIDRSVVQRP